MDNELFIKKIPRKDAEHMFHYINKAKDILMKYDEDDEGGFVDCCCDEDVAEAIMYALCGFSVMCNNSGK